MTRFTRCELCHVKIPEDKCEFATHTLVIDGKEHTLCCEKCAGQNKRGRRN